MPNSNQSMQQVLARIAKAGGTQAIRLDLSGLKLTEIPEQVLACNQLRILDLHNNQIAAIPDSLANLSKLQSLDLNNNQIAAIPDSLANLSNLQSLSLHNNQIAAIPDSLANLSKLQYLYLNNNQINEPNLLAAINQGLDSLRSYLGERKKSQTKNWTAKLMIIGDGRVGKSCLLHRLKTGNFAKDLPFTHNLEIQELKLNQPSNPELPITLRVWDFGGQYFYQATHQFFYSGKSVFLLVWNPREPYERSNLPSWLDRLRALAPTSKVLLVATHARDHSPNIPFAQLKDQYPQIAGEAPFSIDSETGEGVDELRQAVLKQTQLLDHIGATVPGSWSKAAKAIQDTNANHLSADEFLKLLQQAGVDDPDQLAQHWNYTGEITYFSKNPIYNPDQPELTDWVILRPDWLLQKFSLCLADTAIPEAHGALTQAQIHSLWPDLTQGMRDYLLKLMEHFDLAYRTDTLPIQSIIVEKSPEGRPAEAVSAWEDAQAKSPSELALEYRFKDSTVPPGLPTWFIARSHRFTDPQHHWRHGAFLQDRDNKHSAWIESNLANRRVTLKACGPYPPVNFFALLQDCFEGTARRFPGLAGRIERFVPCGGTPDCNGFNLDSLVQRMQCDKFKIECNECFKEHDVRELLYGLHPSSQEQILKDIQNKVTNTATQVAELQEYIKREFLSLFENEQNKIESHCPPIFTLEFERQPDNLPSTIEGMWNDLTDKPFNVKLTLYCTAHKIHPVKTYTIEAPGSLLVRLTPLIKKLEPIVDGLKEFIPRDPAFVSARAAAGSAKSLLKSAQWSDASSPLVEELEGEHYNPTRAHGRHLHALRELLELADPQNTHRWGGLQKHLTKQYHYHWLCDEHFKQMRNG